MDNVAVFKLQIIKYALISAAVFEAGSIPVIGFSLEYLCGLLAGTFTAIAGFLVLLFMSEKVLSSGVKWMASVGYLIRLPVYGVAFYVCMKTGGFFAGAACLIGFMTTVTAMIYVHGIKNRRSSKANRKNGKEE